MFDSYCKLFHIDATINFKNNRIDFFDNRGKFTRYKKRSFCKYFANVSNKSSYEKEKFD